MVGFNDNDLPITQLSCRDDEANPSQRIGQNEPCHKMSLSFGSLTFLAAKVKLDKPVAGWDW